MINGVLAIMGLLASCPPDSSAQEAIATSLTTGRTTPRPAYPEFTWDHIPLYMHIRKAKFYTDEEIEFLARFPLITFEKANGHEDHGSVEAGTLIAARAVKEINPNTTILYYRNVMVHYGGYAADERLAQIPGAMLQDQNGNNVAEISIFPLPEGGEAVAGATIVTPLETLLTRQITLSVDGGAAKRYPFTFCAEIGCVSRAGFVQEDVDAFRRGSEAELLIVPVAAPDQTVTLTISLSGFTAGFARSLVSGWRRLPSPPASTITSTFGSMAIARNRTQRTHTRRARRLRSRPGSANCYPLLTWSSRYSAR